MAATRSWSSSPSLTLPALRGYGTVGLQVSISGITDLGEDGSKTMDGKGWASKHEKLDDLSISPKDGEKGIQLALGMKTHLKEARTIGSILSW